MIEAFCERRSHPRVAFGGLLLACCWLSLASGVWAADAAAPREVHGMADGFVVPGVAIAWGVLHAANEASTVVVIRVVADPARYAWVGVASVDPFSKQEQPLRPVAPSSGVMDVRAPRSHFADFPRTEFRLYESEAAARSGVAALVVFYLGVPDTTPEFKAADKLEAYLAERIARLGGAGSKSP